jgi:hypothetical protein
METIKEKLDNYDKMLGYKKISISIPVFKVVKYIKNYFGEKERCDKKESKWIYECGCTATPEAYRTMPYCSIHGMKLILKDVEG